MHVAKGTCEDQSCGNRGAERALGLELFHLGQRFAQPLELDCASGVERSASGALCEGLSPLVGCTERGGGVASEGTAKPRVERRCGCEPRALAGQGGMLAYSLNEARRA